MHNRWKIVGFVVFTMGIMGSFCSNPDAHNKKSTQQIDAAWRVHFPKTTTLVEERPHPDSLYVFLMAGQSNMAGRGFVEPQDTLPHKSIWTIDRSMNWVYAKEPLHFYEPSLTGLDCGMAFARKLLDSIPEGISIALIPCAVGGSSIEQWIENETFRGVTLLDNFKAKVRFAKDHGVIKGILWHQGESNAKSALIPTYSNRLDELMDIFRTVVENDTLPILLGELGSYAEPPEKQRRWDAISNIMHQVAATDEHLAVVETGDLNHKGDKVHFNAASQRKLGERYAAHYLELTQPTYNARDSQ